MTSLPKKVLRVLHVGVSNRGEWPLKKCDASTGFQPAALCDVSVDALKNARAITGLPESACFTNFDLALKESAVDCAIICAPTVLHMPLVSKAIDAKIPTLVEKGMAPDWANATLLARRVKESGVPAAVAQNYRYNDMERTVARAIHDSTFEAFVGDVHQLTYTQQRVRPIPRTLTYPFASVWDMSCHHFDNMLFWLGPMREMSAHSFAAKWSAYEHESNTSAHIVFRNGTNVHYLHTHDAARSSLEIEVHGERGALVVSEAGITFNERPLEQFGTRPVTPVAMETTGGGEAGVLRDFHRYIVERVEPGISVANNLETMAACEMMVRSITQKKSCRREELNS